ncbi:MAG: trigger factor [Bacteroidia bacterium]
MNITKETLDGLNAVVTIEIGPSDYEKQVDDAIKKIQLKAKLPGFRPGKVPAGMIKKMHGKSVLADELHKMLNTGINKYIVENKLEILGNPLPKSDEKNEWKIGNAFTFKFDIGLAPAFEVEISDKTAFTYEVVKIDNELIDKYVKDVRKNYGKPTNPDVAEERDVVFVDINELDETGDIKAGGIFKSTSIGIDRLKSEVGKQKLIGVKKEDKVIINCKDLYTDAVELAVSLGINNEEAEALTCNLQLSVKNIARMDEAEMNEELFAKVYGDGSIKTEEEFRNKVKEELASMFTQDSDRKFFDEVEKSLIDTLNPALPEEFLKRWIMAENEKPVTMEEISADFAKFSRSMKWQLIENKIISRHHLKVTKEEVTNEAKRSVRSYFARYGHQPDEKEVEKTAEAILQKEKEAKKIVDGLYYAKMLHLFKNNYKLNNKEVSYNEFFGIKEK